MAHDDDARLVDDDRLVEAEFTDAVRDLLHLFLRVLLGVLLVWSDCIDGAFVHRFI